MSEPRNSPDAAAIRARLSADRASTQQRIDDLSSTFAAVVESARDVATDDEHDPEGQTIAYERAQVATLMSQAHEQLATLDRALERLAAGTYGRCDRCGRPIPAERLEARPAATECVLCASSPRRGGSR